MQAMGRVRVIADPPPTSPSRSSTGRAWLLDADAFHDEFEILFRDAETSEGLARMRWMATQQWRSSDDEVQAYIDFLRTSSADDWEAAYDPAQQGEWYRVLMAGHLEVVPSSSNPRALRDGLIRLGVGPTEARRFAFGRELTSLVAAYASDAVVTEIAPLLMLGSRGWLDADDVELGIGRLHALDRTVFRDNQALVPLVEELHTMLVTARECPDQVLLLLDGPPRLAG
jgi:hypothetical protein